MKTIEIKTKKDITIKKGTIIPMLTPYDTPLGYEIIIPKESTLQESNQHCYIIIKESNGAWCATPYHPAIFKAICDKAIEDGSEKIVTEDNKRVFKMFSLITENRITPEEGNYITEFDAENIKEAEDLAKEFVTKSNLSNDFRYCIRE